MKNQTLLEKAKAVKSGRAVVPGDVDILIAWLNGEIRSRHICVALGKPSNQPSHAYNFLIRSIKLAFVQGRIKIVDKS